ncbi:MAG TPA: hypothetical protein DDW94_00715 [Deltaproteobacteria bacterium]|nr:MAG: hypothetical protein A2Z79_06080 [Deltaproteobacteria bacterium GWA2_55_82]OGQ62205.1 MAG: hypothetical protein A3I81_12070 [Deltaproteobacteria bacterium RIFCSPLOWO2_02_FULL_55_12]OIJ73246.1 MAG: hypothetical protein A2V21_302580 [Deltaproteobacteria bacterium GWC2_55_46]HBG45491.1 hypothetical protein [Deltaproteobacteria bacterium]HCY10322.1 hypothetical protein [Deltaproteobacteria bacterium]
MKKVRSRYIQPDFQFIRFRLGKHEFGMDVSRVKEIVRLKEVVAEGVPGFLEGRVKVRSMLIPALDLRRRFSLPVVQSENVRIIVCSVDSLIIGLIVDEVSEITLAAKEATLRPEAKGDAWDGCVEASVDTDSGKVIILDTARILTDAEKRALASPVTRQA